MWSRELGIVSTVESDRLTFPTYPADASVRVLSPDDLLDEAHLNTAEVMGAWHTEQAGLSGVEGSATFAQGRCNRKGR